MSRDRHQASQGCVGPSHTPGLLAATHACMCAHVLLGFQACPHTCTDLNSVSSGCSGPPRPPQRSDGGGGVTAGSWPLIGCPSHPQG